MRLELIDGVVHFHQLGEARLNHDELTKLCQYTVWDYIAPGENLLNYLRRVNRIPTSFLLAVVERILHVLHACETQGVARHGDLHAGNILIGDSTNARLDDFLMPRAPIYVSDFGYGTTGGMTPPKDDYDGLGQIINGMIQHIDYATATATHRQILVAMQRDLGRLLREPAGAERRKPLELLRVLNELKRSAQTEDRRPLNEQVSGPNPSPPPSSEAPSVGQFQVSEMIGDRWNWWLRLFVPKVPARSKILALDIPTVVTGPRGCGKTMLFRRLSGKKVDKYTLLNFVGAGRIGYVYRAQHEDFSESPRAVKLIFDELKQGWDVELKKVRRTRAHATGTPAPQLRSGHDDERTSSSLYPGRNRRRSGSPGICTARRA